MVEHSPKILTSMEKATTTTDIISGSWDSLLVQRRTHDQKVASLNPGRSGRRIFFFRVNFVC